MICKYYYSLYDKNLHAEFGVIAIDARINTLCGACHVVFCLLLQ